MSILDLLRFGDNALDYAQPNPGFLREDMLAPELTVPDFTALSRITSVGRMGDSGLQVSKDARPLTSSALAALNAANMPLAWQIEGTGDEVHFYVGSWTTTSGHAAKAQADGDRQRRILDLRLSVIKANIATTYEDIEYAKHERKQGSFADAVYGRGRAKRYCALGLGMPSRSTNPSMDNQIDRLLRAMRGYQSWTVLCVAQPLKDRSLANVHQAIADDQNVLMQSFTGLQADSAYNARRNALLEVLENQLDDVRSMRRLGGWRTAVYIGSDDGVAMEALSSSFPSLYIQPGQDSDHVKVWRPSDPGSADRFRELVSFWALPNREYTGDRFGLGYLRRNVYQSLLASDQLAAYVQLPTKEVPGFSVTLSHKFDTVKRPPAPPRVGLGRILRGSAPTASDYLVARDDLVKHALVCGVTGQGKTSTIVHLLDQSKCPFMVIEPTKTEYRRLVGDPGRSVTVLSCGDEQLAPLRLNPFQVSHASLLQTHVERVKALFTATFALWSPLPQLLERAMLDCYRAHGWNVARGLGPRTSMPKFPTLTEVTRRVEALIASLAYSGEVVGNMRAALSSRLDGLRVGSRGLMLDTSVFTSDDALFESPVVVELEGIGDDDDKAFMMGLLLLRLTEYRRLQGGSQSPVLKHILVIEEAHRLLSRTVDSSQAGFGSPRAKAVETFTNLLAEVRAYGQSVIVADQVPVRLAPEVLKNTNLKIAHRTVAEDDRDALAAAMAMTPEQSRALSTLEPRRAAVFAEGDDSPLLVEIGAVPNRRDAQHSQIIANYGDWRRRWGIDDDSHGLASSLRDAARPVAESDQLILALARMVVSSLDDDRATIKSVWSEIAQRINALSPSGADPDEWRRVVTEHACDFLAYDRAIDAGADSVLAGKGGSLLFRVISAFEAGDMPTEGLMQAHREASLALCRVPAYEAPRLCEGCRNGQCPYRYSARRLIRAGVFNVEFRACCNRIESAGLAEANAIVQQEMLRLQGFAQEIVRGPNKTADSADGRGRWNAAARCLLQNWLMTDVQLAPYRAASIIDRVVDVVAGPS